MTVLSQAEEIRRPWRNMVSDTVAVRVEQTDALGRTTDMLVLKYAQASYGVDRTAVELLGIDRSSLPAPGEHIAIHRPTGIAARSVLILGVVPLYHFGYREIREFARSALSLTARARPEVRDLSLTLHGPGYGLDEIEAFESELAGVVDAVVSREAPPGLRSVTFAELEPDRAERMQTALALLLPDFRLRTTRPFATQSAAGLGIAERLRSVGYDSQARAHAFVAMPFAEAFEDVFHFGIAQPIRRAGLLCERMDKISFTGDVIARMKDRIRSAEVVVADLSQSNPNVYLEVGYAWGCSVPTILLCDRKTDLKFDLRTQRCLMCSSIRDLEQKLAVEISAILER